MKTGKFLITICGLCAFSVLGPVGVGLAGGNITQTAAQAGPIPWTETNFRFAAGLEDVEDAILAPLFPKALDAGSFGSDHVHTVKIELQRSASMHDWEVVQITDALLTGKGRVRLPAGDNAPSFHLRIKIGDEGEADPILPSDAAEVGPGVVELELWRSADLWDWEAVPITADQLTEDGKVRQPATAIGGFFRVRIAVHVPRITHMVQVKGGTLPAISSLGVLNVTTFSVSRHHVTWGEWKEVREWAAENGYDIGGVGEGCADDHPVHSINWYDALKWCNAKSEKEGFAPVYTINGSVYRSGEAVPVWDTDALGYRLPAEAEWEFAARGGNQSQGYRYSGSDNLNAVGWYVDNSSGAVCDMEDGRGSWPVGLKQANELGLYDMSGNVWDWCWEATGSYRRIRGGSWRTFDNHADLTFRGRYLPGSRSSVVLGLRLAWSSGSELPQ